MAEKRCETCYYWTRHYHPPTRGTCKVDAFWLLTESRFFCHRWRARTAALPKLTRLLRILRNIEAWEPLGDLDEEYLEPLLVVLEEMAWAVLDAAAKASPTGMAGGGGPELWDAINRYVAACGGDPSQHVYGNTERQLAVAEVCPKLCASTAANI